MGHSCLSLHKGNMAVGQNPFFVAPFCIRVSQSAEAELRDNEGDRLHDQPTTPKTRPATGSTLSESASLRDQSTLLGPMGAGLR